MSYKNLFFLLTKLLCAVLLGLLAFIVSLQYDPEVRRSIKTELIAALETTLDCKVSATLGPLNFFHPTVSLKNLKVSPRDQADWKWHAKEYTLRFSWFDFLLTKTIVMHMHAYDVHAYSALSNNTLAIYPHLLKMVTGQTDIPLVVKSLSITPAHFTLHDKEADRQAMIAWNSTSKSIGDIFRSHLEIIDGSLTATQKIVGNKMAGTLEIDVSETVDKQLKILSSTKLSAHILGYTESPCTAYLKGTWDTDTGHCSISTSDKSIDVPQLTIACTDSQWDANGMVHLPVIGPLEISAILNKQKTVLLQATNSQECAVINGYTIAPHNLIFKGAYDLDNTGTGTWQATIQKSPEQTMHAQGSLNLEYPNISYHVNVGDFKLEGSASVNDCIDTHATITYLDSPIMQAECTKADAGIQGHTSLTVLQPLMNKLLGHEIDGEGTVHCKVWYEKNGAHCMLTLENGAVRLPYTYNHIKTLQMHAVYNFATQCIHIQECTGALYKGSFVAAPTTLSFSDWPVPRFWHVPVLFDSCLLTLQRGMFALISGALVSEKRPGVLPFVRGHLILDRAQLNEHLLSAHWLRSLIATVPQTMHEPSADVICDVTLETKEPIRVKTDMLQTHALLRLRLTDSIANPKVQGTITLQGGQFSLPYKPLYITKALLTFDHLNPTDPHLDLVAKNLIKKHHITLQITGSLQHPQIMLESTPPLTEEQIINLLVTGTQEKSLGAALPTLIVQSLKNLILGEQSIVSGSENIQRLLKPLNRVHIIPRFADQTGRGGLRGAVEIDVSDRLSVLLQKNFSVFDDTRLEVEYMLSDDISLRGVRDERKDVTGEVEMKWKF